MKAYSTDFCAKIAQACDAGAASRRQLTRQFRVSDEFGINLAMTGLYGQAPRGEGVVKLTFPFAHCPSRGPYSPHEQTTCPKSV
jgi:hypothetical protein